MADNAYILEADPSRQKCSSFRICIKDTSDSSATKPTFAITTLALYAGIKKGLWKGDASRRLT
jgi:hypothetical protein